MFERDYWETAMKDDLPRPKTIPARCRWVQRGLQCDLCRGHEGTCVFAQERTYNGFTPEPGFPAQPPNLGVASARDVLREQSELIAKYAAHCEGKTSTCSNVATLLEYTARAKLARDMSLIYFRAATLED